MFDRNQRFFLRYIKMMRSRLVYIILSFIVSAGLIWLLISRIDTKDLFQTLAEIYWPALLAFAAISFCAAILRAWRYQWLLRLYSVKPGQIFLVTLIRNLFVDLLPARVGSLSYIYILNKRLNFPFEAATSSFLLSVVFDFITLSPFLILAILAVGLGTSIVSSTHLLGFAVVFLFFISLITWKLRQVCLFLIKIFQFLLQKFKLIDREWSKNAIKKLHSTVICIQETQKNKIFWPVFFLSFGIRLLKYTSLHFLLYSLVKSRGFILSGMSIWKTILGITGAELTSVLPVKGIAGFGTWESAWALTFRLMKFQPDIAIISGIGVHLITNIFEYSLGIISILILLFPFLGKKELKKNNS